MMELFAAAQMGYAFCNLMYMKLFLKFPRFVSMDRKPTKYPNIDVFIAAYKERYEILRDNVKSLLNQDYPKDKIKIHIVVEEHDHETLDSAYAVKREFMTLAVTQHRGGTQETSEEHGVDIVQIPHNRHENWHKVLKHAEIKPDTHVPYGKGRALLYALHHAKTSKDVICVFDAEDIAPPKLFAGAVSGLQQGYDVVQGLISYRNWNKNMLTALQSAEPVIWSRLFYPNTSNESVPFQVLGPAYFFAYKLAMEQKGWNPFTTSEDVHFGISAWNRKKRLGILNMYTSELGVETLGAWLAQRRRWARGHQEHFITLPLGLRARVNFFTYTINSQIINMVSLIGVPTGIYLFVRSVERLPTFISPYIVPILYFNLAMWLITATYLMYEISRAYAFRNIKEKLAYILRVNPLTLLFYSMLWSVPVVLGLWDNVVRLFTKKLPVWEKTPH